MKMPIDYTLANKVTLAADVYKDKTKAGRHIVARPFFKLCEQLWELVQ